MRRTFSLLMSTVKNPVKPAARIATSGVDIWSLVNGAAAELELPPVNLGQGFMDFGPEKYVTDEAKRALDQASTNHYSPTRGRPRLLEALAKAYSPFYQRQLDPNSEIVVTAGANEGIFSAIAAFIEPGDEVIIFEPFFDFYIPPPQFFGGKIVYIPIHAPKEGNDTTTSSAEWKVDMKELKSKISSRTKMMIINTPWNPVGKVFSREELQEISQIAIDNNIIVVSDEVYDALYYVPFTRIATLSPEISRLTLTVGSGGKIFNATGWRVGWVIGEASLMKHVAAAHTRVTFTVNSPLQEGIAVGFEKAEEHNYFQRTIDDYQKRVKRFTKVFDEIGLPYTVPEGGYFVLANFARVQRPADYQIPKQWTDGRAKDFAMVYWLLKEFGVVAIPPTEFYTPENAHLGEDYLVCVL